MDSTSFTKLQNSPFKQQKIPSWRPNLSGKQIFIIYQFVGVLCFMFGLFCLIKSNEIEELVFPDYEGNCNRTDRKECLSGIADADMKPPLLLYYELDNFYQNHRRYVKSRSDRQLSGQNLTVVELTNSKECEPAYNNSVIGVSKSVTGKPLDGGAAAFPCGLIAKSFFNETYKVFINEEEVKVDETNIAWKSDKKYKFKNYDLDSQWLDVENEHFIVWMKTAPKAKFRKLWGRLNTTIKKNDIVTIGVNNNYLSSRYGAKKNLVITTVNVLGGKNTFLAVSSIIIGILIILMGLVLLNGSKYYNTRHLENNFDI